MLKTIARILKLIKADPVVKTLYLAADRLEDMLGYVRRLTSLTWAFAKSINSSINKVPFKTGNKTADLIFDHIFDNLNGFAIIGAALQLPLLVYKMIYSAFFSKDDVYSRAVQFLLVGVAAAMTVVSILVIVGVLSIASPYLLLAGAIRSLIEHGVGFGLALRNRFWPDSETTRITKKNQRQVLRQTVSNLQDEIHQLEDEIEVLKNHLSYDDNEAEQLELIEDKVNQLIEKKRALKVAITARNEALLEIDGNEMQSKIQKRRAKLIEKIREAENVKAEMDNQIHLLRSNLDINSPTYKNDLMSIHQLELQKERIDQTIHARLDDLTLMYNTQVNRNDKILSKTNASLLALGMLAGSILLFTPISPVGTIVILATTAIALADVVLASTTGKNTVQWLSRGLNQLLGAVMREKPPINLTRKSRESLLAELQDEIKRDDNNEPHDEPALIVANSRSDTIEEQQPEQNDVPALLLLDDENDKGKDKAEKAEDYAEDAALDRSKFRNSNQFIQAGLTLHNVDTQNVASSDEFLAVLHEEKEALHGKRNATLFSPPTLPRENSALNSTTPEVVSKRLSTNTI